MSGVPLPQGFTAHVANIGIKDDTDDFVVIASDRPCAAVAVFTRSRFAGPSVEVSREHAADGTLQAVVVVSKNANVATGPQGLADARELAHGVAAAVGCGAGDVLVTSTGVIGRPYPMERVREHLPRPGPALPRHRRRGRGGGHDDDRHPPQDRARPPSRRPPAGRRPSSAWPRAWG